MKKELVVTAILLANPVANIQAEQFQTEVSKIISENIELAEVSFLSKRWHRDVFYNYNGPGRDPVKEERTFKVRISFVQATPGNYRYDGQGELDYQVFIEKIDEYGNVIPDGNGYWDSVFYAKKVNDHKFKVYDCDSTSNCSEEFNNREFRVYNTPKGKILKLGKNSDSDFDVDIDLYDRVFYETRD